MACLIPDCSKPVHGHGLCSAHYTRHRRHGDPLSGGTSPGEPIAFVESAFGHRGDECLIWPFTRGGRGYAQINIAGRKVYVARLVCERLYGPAPSPDHEAAHSCGMGHEGCINPSHVRWATPIENAADRLLHGTHLRGDRHPLVKLSPAAVLDIRKQRGIITQEVLAARYGVTRRHISRVQLGNGWGWMR